MFSDPAPFALFDDNLDRGGDLLLRGLREHIVCFTPADVPDAFAAIEAARARGGWIALAADYELGHALEPRLQRCLRAGSSPLLSAWVFDRAERGTAESTSAGLDRYLAGLDEHERIAGIAALSPSLSQDEYFRAVERIRTLIDAGDCYQVNFTMALRGIAYGDPLALYRRLREAQPVRHGALIRHADGVILSRSPELFVERHGTTLTCRPMKGTAACDTDPELLARSEKNRAENVMIVDLIRNDLGRLAPAGGVRVGNLFEIEGYPSVLQMTSTVVAEPVSADLLAVFRALFPCGSVTGAPKIRAMEIIRELESEPRGLYCGALGWIAPDGDFRFSVPIRTLVMDADRNVRLGIGSGIVADSEPQSEWEESLLKTRFVEASGPEFGLIETLRCEAGTGTPYPLLELHLQRLAASAAHFGFSLDAAAVRKALNDEAASLSGVHRVRLELKPSGEFDLRSTPLEAPVPGSTPTVVISPQRVSSRDPLLRHKTTARNLYDRELDRAVKGGHFDAVFFNEQGELAEGARSNLFVDIGEASLLTPPLGSGVLNGVYRRKLIAAGRAREARLTLDDLRNARAIYAANAARGLVRVRLAEPAT
jgi:para-aminobenzoate synthetase/4-amino-4-deoxychorismate lyase